MRSHQLLVAAMKRALNESEIKEVAASGEFILPSTRPSLFPGGVYGFGVHLDESELRDVFEEARERKLNRISDLSGFRSIEGDFYPLYWGKDKQLGARPYQHLNDPTKTGAIRLSTYESLAGKTIACATLVVSDYAKAEAIIQRVFPDLLKTTTRKHAQASQTI